MRRFSFEFKEGDLGEKNQFSVWKLLGKILENLKCFLKSIFWIFLQVSPLDLRVLMRLEFFCVLPALEWIKIKSSIEFCAK